MSEGMDSNWIVCPGFGVLDMKIIQAVHKCRNVHTQVSTNVVQLTCVQFIR